MNKQDQHDETSKLLAEISLRDKETYTAIETSTAQGSAMTSGKRRRFHTSITVFLFVVVVALILVITSQTNATLSDLLNFIYDGFLFGPIIRYHHHSHIVYHQIPREYSNRQSTCSNDVCFQPPQPDNDTPQVATNRVGFPSYWNYATGQNPIDVSYDKRSILLNGQRSLFIGGSMHPTRATPLTWDLALDKAVDNGLNLITIYVLWAAHQPTANSTLDWNLSPKPISGDKNEWSISSAIRSAAKRGLFVHIRIGPFDCAEYNYGGIPEWIPLLHPDMEMRSLDGQWLDLMEQFVKSIVSYLQNERLFAYQGGPIIMAQIENEINGDVETGVKRSDDDLVSHHGKKDGFHSRHISRKKVQQKSDFRHQNGRSLLERPDLKSVTDLQDYADWCGQLADKIAPDVVWTMCNGLSASNTIETYNGQFFDTWWLENYGASHRIQVDRPALWTEHEGM
jgi:Glycosyl hydrolases family 35